MKKLVIAMSALSAILFACELSAAPKRPEESKLFERQVDPESGIVSWWLKPGIFSFHQQAEYFTAKSMTDDGRFIYFRALDSEFEEDGKTKKKNRLDTIALIDMETEKIVNLGIDRQIMFLDVKTDQLWYFAKRKVCRRDLLVDPMKEIVVCGIPETLLVGAKEVHYWSTHPTLTADRKKMFIAPHIDDRYEQGLINLETGEWESWGTTDFYTNHDQINPVRDDVALVAWEGCWEGKQAIDYRKKTGWYPRMWLVYPDGRRVMQPSRLPGHNYATHEHWTEDGTGFYWCHQGVIYQNLATGEQEVVCSNRASHATMSADNRYVTHDAPVGNWYRGCKWQVGFWNRDTGRGVYIYSCRPALCDDDGGWHDHPDPHPSFVCNDRYVLCTANGEDHRMNLSITPVAQLVERTSNLAGSFVGLDAGKSPAKVSKRISDQFLSTRPENYKPEGYFGNDGYGGNKTVQYSVVSLWVNALECARMTGDRERMVKLCALFDDFRPGRRFYHVCPRPYHVDDTVFGALSYEIYIQTCDKAALEMGNWYADTQWAPPCWGTYVERHNACKEKQAEYHAAGYTPQTRLWIDDMYMITFLQSQAYRATGDRKYIDRAAKEMIFYLDKLQLKEGPAAGLFHHAPDTPFVWGRGDGWMAAGMALVLDRLPTESAYRERIMQGYHLMMEKLLGYQRKDGLWCQLVDRPDDSDNWGETSATAMFAYSFAVGVRRGWLDAEKYGPPTRKAYEALCSRLDGHANLSDVCEGTGKKNDLAYYFARRRVNGDPHGQAPMLWLAGELLKGGVK